MTRTANEAREELARAREQLALRLTQIRADEARRQPLSSDSADRAQEQENDEVLERLDRATEILLAQCRHAIERIDQGQYGVCEHCGFDIGEQRLRAVPQATSCAACASAVTQRAA